MSESFALNSLMKLYSSDFLCPSKSELRKINDLGSLEDSLKSSQIDLFDGRIIYTYSNKLSSLSSFFKATLRVTAVYAIGAFAIIGVIYNTARILPVLRAIDETGKARKIELKKAISADMTCFSVSTLSLSILIGFPLGLTTIFLTSKCFINITKSLQLVTSREERAGYIKAIRLKMDFGIVGKNGQILTPKVGIDNEDFYIPNKGSLGRLCELKATAFLEEIKELQIKLGRLHKLYSPWDGVPKAQDILRTLRGKYYFLPLDIKHKINLTEIESKLTRLQNEYNEAWEGFVECEIQKRSIYSLPDLKMHYSERKYIFDRAKVDSYFNPPMNDDYKGYYNENNYYNNKNLKVDSWTNLINQSLADIKEEVIPELTEDYKNFRKLVLLKKKPLELLQLFNPKLTVDKAAVIKAYRQASLRIHPDKVEERLSGLDDSIKERFKKEATALFKVLEAAKSDLAP